MRLGDSSSWEIPPFSQQQMGFVYQVAAKVRISTSLHFSADVFGVVKKSLNASMITLLSIPDRGGKCQNVRVGTLLSTCPLYTNSGCGKERRILIGPW